MGRPLGYSSRNEHATPASARTHFEILQQDSEANQADDAANASIRAQFFLTDGQGRVECGRNAEQEYINEASQKLAKSGYSPPDKNAVAAPQSAAGDAGSPLGDLSCSLQQITAMARSGLTDEQILAACG